MQCLSPRSVLTLAFAGSLLLLACGGGGGTKDTGPYTDIEADRRIKGDSLDGQADVLRDQFGVPHIHASSMSDLAYAQGYVMAADRLPQMDLFRHLASGTVAELFGALDPDQIDTDLEMRMHRFRPVAEETWTELSSSSDPIDIEISAFLQRFSDGVNQYLGELADGEHLLDPAVGTWFDASRAAPWTPVDSLVIGRLQAWSLSYSDGEVSSTGGWQRAFDLFNRAADSELHRQARTGIAHDIFRLEPMDPTSTIDEFPANASAAPRLSPSTAKRPRISERLLALTKRALEPKQLMGGVTLRDPRNGSNNWVIGPKHTDGRTIMANDPHLTLSSPSIFYLNHLTVPGRVDVQGITFPGIPGVILGHNEHVAWGATTANHDVTDFYLETVVPCAAGGGDCVVFNGAEVAIETWQETIKVGALGTITETRTVTYERVPHHGPIVPRIADGQLVPRTGAEAISVRYTGHGVTHELRAFYRLWTTATVAEGIEAMHDFGFGAQNWVFADDQGSIGWTTHALLPKRSAGCYTFDPVFNAEGVAPWWILPGDGSCEWEGFWAPGQVPFSQDPDKGYLVTANADPVGGNSYGDPLNRPMIDGYLHYVGGGFDYAQGWRAGRITRRLQALIDEGTPLTADMMAELQADAHSNFGSAMQPFLHASVLALQQERATPGTHEDLAAYAAGLSAADDSFLAITRQLLENWSFDTPAAVGGSPSAQELTDSAATSLTNAWAVYYIDSLLADEAQILGISTGTFLSNAIYTLFAKPRDLKTTNSVVTNEPLLCDDINTASVAESCRLQLVSSLADVQRYLEGTVGFGSADPNDWRWGEKHRLTLEALIPADELAVPPPGTTGATAGGFPRHGDPYAVDASSPGFGDLDFSYDHGPAMRHITELRPGQRPITRMALPGGQIYDRDSGHFRDLMDQYWSQNEYFVLPWSTAQIIESAESRWRFE